MTRILFLLLFVTWSAALAQAPPDDIEAGAAESTEEQAAAVEEGDAGDEGEDEEEDAYEDQGVDIDDEFEDYDDDLYDYEVEDEELIKALAVRSDLQIIVVDPDGGRIEIQFHSLEHLDELLNRIAP